MPFTLSFTNLEIQNNKLITGNAHKSIIRTELVGITVKIFPDARRRGFIALKLPEFYRLVLFTALFNIDLTFP